MFDKQDILLLRETVLRGKILSDLENTKSVDILDKVDGYIKSTGGRISKLLFIEKYSSDFEIMYCKVTWESSITGNVFNFGSYFVRYV